MVERRCQRSLTPNTRALSLLAVSGLLVVLATGISASQLLFGSSQYYISIGYRDKSLPSFLFLQEMCKYVESDSSLTAASGQL